MKKAHFNPTQEIARKNPNYLLSTFLLMYLNSMNMKLLHSIKNNIIENQLLHF